MSLTTKQIIDEFNRPDPCAVEGEYGQYVEDLYNDGLWPSNEELQDDLDHE